MPSSSGTLNNKKNRMNAPEITIEGFCESLNQIEDMLATCRTQTHNMRILLGLVEELYQFLDKMQEKSCDGAEIKNILEMQTHIVRVMKVVNEK